MIFDELGVRTVVSNNGNLYIHAHDLRDYLFEVEKAMLMEASYAPAGRFKDSLMGMAAMLDGLTKIIDHHDASLNFDNTVNNVEEFPKLVEKWGNKE